ncbi:MAG: hypothetical protein IT337_10610 [Thermomicrobiales bacterium]|nr:hypothetical protein [Thermomicrobiales bacterium]
MTVPVTGYDLPLDEAPAMRGPEGPWNEDDVLDQVLRLVADHHMTLGVAIGKRSFSPSLAELRQSPLGRDLRVLAAGAYGEAASPLVQAAAERVREMLLRPIAGDDYAVPAWFWASELGRIMARAERIALGEGGLLTLAQAAAWLGVAPATLETWVADGTMLALPDEAGRPLLPRRAVERWRIVGLALNRGERASAPAPDDVVVHPERLSA